MNTFGTVGRILLAIGLVSLGLEHIVTGNFPMALFPFPAQFPGRSVVVLTLGLALITAGVCIGLLRKASVAAFGLGLLFLLSALCLHVPPLLTNIYNGSAWTVFGELLAFSGGTFYGAGHLAQDFPTTLQNKLRLSAVGNLLFSVSLLIFGILHFVYASYIATLIPSWIPAPLFWAYFVGVAFVGTAISLVVNWQRTLSTGLLGLMFLLWVVVLHAPRVIRSPQTEPEWTSLLVALVMSGIAFILAGSNRPKTAAIRVDTLPLTERSE